MGSSAMALSFCSPKVEEAANKPMTKLPSMLAGR